LEARPTGHGASEARVSQGDLLALVAKAYLLEEATITPLERGAQNASFCVEAEVTTYAALRTYLSCTSAWSIEGRYLNPEAYQSRWDRFIKEPSDWWGRNGDQVTERLIRLSARVADRREP